MIKLVLRSDIAFDEPLQARSISSSPVAAGSSYWANWTFAFFFSTLPLPCMRVYLCVRACSGSFHQPRVILFTDPEFAVSFSGRFGILPYNDVTA